MKCYRILFLFITMLIASYMFLSAQVTNPSTVTFISTPDSLVPDTLNTQQINVNLVDSDGIDHAFLSIIESRLTLNVNNTFDENFIGVSSVDQITFDINSLPGRHSLKLPARLRSGT